MLMSTSEIVLGIITLVLAVVLIVLVLVQSGKEKSLSGTIAGAAETFFSKGKSKSRDKILSRITTMISVAFGILAVAFYIVVSKLY